jgi:hypothetical protein
MTADDFVGDLRHYIHEQEMAPRYDKESTCRADSNKYRKLAGGVFGG